MPGCFARVLEVKEYAEDVAQACVPILPLITSGIDPLSDRKFSIFADKSPRGFLIFQDVLQSYKTNIHYHSKIFGNFYENVI